MAKRRQKEHERNSKRQYNLQKQRLKTGSEGKTTRSLARTGAITSTITENEKTERQLSSDRASYIKEAVSKWNGLVGNTPATDVDQGSKGLTQSNTTGDGDGGWYGR